MKNKKKIKNILNNFDFQKIHECMVRCNPPWVRSDGIVPTQGQLKKEAKRLLVEAIKSKEKVFYIGTGGFFVLKCYKILHLMFCMEWRDSE